MAQRVWVAVLAGGCYQTVWDAKDKVWYLPTFRSHDDAQKFWHGKTEDRHAWALTEIGIEGK